MSEEEKICVLADDTLDTATQRFRETPGPDEPPPYTILDSVTASASRPANSSNYLPKQESAESSGSTGLPEMKLYGQRWYILLVFGLMACHQCLVWNTWGPIASSVQVAYDWSDGTVAMMANWGTIMFVLTAVPLSWMIESKGLRPTCLLVSGLIMVGAVIRCCRTLLPSPTVFLAACHICSILNGIAGVTVMASPPVISSLWFPQNERTTATSINQAFNMAGNGLAMLVGPALVKVNTPPPNGTNGTDNWQEYTTRGIQAANISSNRDIEDIKSDIDNYMLIDASIALVIFLLFCAYYPSKPPLPPTPTSTIVRTDFKNGIKKLMGDRDILLTCFAYSMSQGIMGSWMGVMVLNLRSLDISDQQVGYIGLGSVIGQIVASLFVARFTDFFRHKIKLTILLLLVVSGALFVVLTMMCLGALPSTFPLLCAAIIAATSLNFACCPLFFELSVEIAYPVAESLVAGFLTATYNLVGIVFLFLFFIPNIGSIWINYVLVGSVVVSVPAVLLIRERYNRSSVDELVQQMTT